MTKTIKVILIISAIIIPVAVLGVAFWPRQDQPENNNLPVITEPNDNQPATTTEVEIITTDIDTSEWQTYRNEEWGFEVKYPREWYHMDDRMMGQDRIYFHVFSPAKPPYEYSYYGIADHPYFKMNVIVANNINEEYNSDFLKSIKPKIYALGSNEFDFFNASNNNYDDEIFYIQNSKKNKLIIFVGVYGGINQKADQKLFYAVLSTFKFIK